MKDTESENAEIEGKRQETEERDKRKAESKEEVTES